MASYRRQDGFTLIELLVAIALFAVVIGLSSITLTSISGFFKKAEQKDDNSYNSYLAVNAVTKALVSTVSYEVTGNGRFGFYFLGRDDGFTGITEQPVFSSSALAVYRFFREVNPDGTFDLIYEEAPMLRPLLYLDQINDFNFRVKYRSGIKDYKFNYYGHLSLETKYDPENQQLVFHKSFDGHKLGMQPISVIIEFDQNVFKFNLADRTEVLVGSRNQNNENT